MLAILSILTAGVLGAVADPFSPVDFAQLSLTTAAFNEIAILAPTVVIPMLLNASNLSLPSTDGVSMSDIKITSVTCNKGKLPGTCGYPTLSAGKGCQVNIDNLSANASATVHISLISYTGEVLINLSNVKMSFLLLFTEHGAGGISILGTDPSIDFDLDFEIVNHKDLSKFLKLFLPLAKSSIISQVQGTMTQAFATANTMIEGLLPISMQVPTTYDLLAKFGPSFLPNFGVKQFNLPNVSVQLSKPPVLNADSQSIIVASAVTQDQPAVPFSGATLPPPNNTTHQIALWLGESLLAQVLWAYRNAGPLVIVDGAVLGNIDGMGLNTSTVAKICPGLAAAYPDGRWMTLLVSMNATSSATMPAVAFTFRGLGITLPLTFEFAVDRPGTTARTVIFLGATMRVLAAVGLDTNGTSSNVTVKVQSLGIEFFDAGSVVGPVLVDSLNAVAAAAISGMHLIDQLNAMIPPIAVPPLPALNNAALSIASIDFTATILKLVADIVAA